MQAPTMAPPSRVDARGSAYVTGVAGSPNFPAVNSVRTHAGSEDVFICKLNPAGSALIFSTTLGGGSGDYGSDLALDAASNIYLAGYTGSADFPTFNPVQLTGQSNGIAADAFAAKLDSTGLLIIYSTYLGGLEHDFGYGVAADTSGNTYVTGSTQASNFPTVTPFQATLGGGFDAFVCKIAPVGLVLLYSTYLGGTDHDIGNGITVDEAGSAYVTGRTGSGTTFPTAVPAQAAFGGAADAFLSQFNPSGMALVHSTFLGGAGDDAGESVALDGVRSVYIIGSTSSSNFPLANPLQSDYAGGVKDVFVARISEVAADLSLSQSDSPDPAPVSEDVTYSVIVTDGGPNGATSVTVTDTLPANITFVSATPEQGSCGEAGGVVTCDLGTIDNDASVGIEIIVRPAEAGVIRNAARVRSATPDANRANDSEAEETFVEDPTTAVVPLATTGLSLALEGPNPAPAGGLRVSFILANATRARLEVVDVTGRVRDIHEIETPDLGPHVLDLGSRAELHAGLYLIRLRQGIEARIVKAVVME